MEDNGYSLSYRRHCNSYFDAKPGEVLDEARDRLKDSLKNWNTLFEGFADDDCEWLLERMDELALALIAHGRRFERKEDRYEAPRFAEVYKKKGGKTCESR